MTRLSVMRSLPPADMSSSRIVSCVMSSCLRGYEATEMVGNARARSSSTQVSAVVLSDSTLNRPGPPKTVWSLVDQARSSFPVVTE